MACVRGHIEPIKVSDYSFKWEVTYNNNIITQREVKSNMQINIESR